MTRSFLSRIFLLANATVSFGELSSAALLRSLPPSLWTLEIITFRQLSDFHVDVLLALRNRNLALHAFKHWRVIGSD